MPRSIRLLVAALAALAVSACANVPPPRPTFPPLSYASQQPLTFEAASVELVNEHVAPQAPPNVEHLAPVAPATAALTWARDRIKVTGTGNRTVKVIVRNAKIVETDLKKTPGLRGAFTTDQVTRYDAEAEVVVEVRGERGFRDAFATGSASRSTSVAENATLNDRDRVLYQLVQGLMQDIDGQLERNINNFMSLYLQR